MFDVSHIAKLARLGLTKDEEQKIAKDLAAILEFVKKLEEVNVEGVEPMTQGTGLSSATRPDEAIKRSKESRVKLLANAPEDKGGYIKVMAVFD